MKTIIILLSFFAIVSVASLSSCGKDDGGGVTCGATWGTDLQQEVNAVSTALTQLYHRSECGKLYRIEKCLSGLHQRIKTIRKMCYPDCKRKNSI